MQLQPQTLFSTRESVRVRILTRTGSPAMRRRASRYYYAPRFFALAFVFVVRVRTRD